MQAGSHVGQFELREVIGRGGMGEVWRAHDVRLERDVALKTLPSRIADHAGSVARLKREARLLATLNHPNIGAILGIEEQEGTCWLVLELVDGPTLEDRLSSGKLPTQEAIGIAMQVAEALRAAHSRGIVHCDLKPSNIKLAADGRVKVLDFGIARSLQTPALAHESTLTVPPGTGEIAGTPVYMSPEQMRGDGVGPTSDIWAFGVLLYRMLTGRLPFEGPTAADTVVHVLQTVPDLSRLRPAAPEALIRLLGRCLEKDPHRRIQHAGDLQILIEEALLPSPSADGPAVLQRFPVIAIAAAALAALAAALWLGWRDEGAQVPVRAELSFERGTFVDRPYGHRRIAIAPDGSRIALAASSALWVRSLSAARPVSISISCTNPFFSPDGAWVGCFNEASGLVKIPAGGGSPIPLAVITERSTGAAWTRDGSILVATTEGLFRVDEGGGQPQLILRPRADQGERQYAWPELLPGERAVLLTVLSRDRGDPPRIIMLDLDSGAIHAVLDGGSSPHFVSGVLVYAAGPRMLAVRFDPSQGKILGEPRAVPDLQLEGSEDNGAAGFALSANGTLVTLRPTPPSSGRALYWRDVRGVETPINIPSGNYLNPRVSPDGKRIAMDVQGRDNRDIWILDLERSSLARMTTDVAEDNLPIWSRDGRRVFFSSNRGGDFDIYSQAPDASDIARREVTAPGPQMMLDTSRDGRHILAVEDFRRLSLFQTGTDSSEPLLHEGAVYWTGSISPDGNWIAYESNESGEGTEIFIRPFPSVKERREKISIDGGRYPVWGPPDSHALYYVQPDGAMMRAELRFEGDLKVGPVTQLFDGFLGYPVPPQITGIPYDVSPVDGRFVLFRSVENRKPEYFHADLVLNWLDELHGLVPE